jgi:DNA polymerase III epsilon subunit-like protein
MLRWIGPKLSALAHECGVAFDPTRAHDAAYDVRVTSQCLVYLKRLHAPA